MLVERAFTDNRTLHNQQLRMRQLTFLHVSHAARGARLGAGRALVRAGL